MKVEQRQAAADPRPSHLTWAVSPPVISCNLLQQPSPFIIIITPPESLYSFTVPRRVSK